jgi:hypothetical protein
LFYLWEEEVLGSRIKAWGALPERVVLFVGGESFVFMNKSLGSFARRYCFICWEKAA